MKISGIDFYFDYLSPYAYFGWLNVAALCKRRQLDLRAHPILFAGLLGHWGQLGPAEIPPKREFVFKDCYRYAAKHHIAFDMPKAHPFHPLLALRLSLLEVSGEQQHRVIDCLWKLCWAQGGDLASIEEVTSALSEAGLNAQDLLARAQSDVAKSALRDHTKMAVSHGVFGIPTMRIGEELFWGNDRFDDVECYLDGRDPIDPQKMRAFLTRPRGADRPGKVLASS